MIMKMQYTCIHGKSDWPVHYDPKGVIEKTGQNPQSESRPVFSTSGVLVKTRVM
jgi:hypothetical protein